MDEQRAREILGAAIRADGGGITGLPHSADRRLIGPRGWVEWIPGEGSASVDTHLTADELEALAWWMRNK